MHALNLTTRSAILIGMFACALGILMPLHHAARGDGTMDNIRPEYLEGKKIGVIAGSSHDAYLRAFFTDAEIVSYANDDAVRQALRRGEVNLIFGDAISLSFWINGTDSGDCCAFTGGPFLESR